MDNTKNTNILILERLEGILEGEPVKLHMATTINMNRFVNYGLEMPDGGRWLRLNERRYRELTFQLEVTRKENYQDVKSEVAYMI